MTTQTSRTILTGLTKWYGIAALKTSIIDSIIQRSAIQTSATIRTNQASSQRSAWLADIRAIFKISVCTRNALSCIDAITATF